MSALRNLFDRVVQGVTNSRVWRSFFRHGLPDDDLDRSLLMTSNFFLHLHPVRVRKDGLRLSYTWGLGGISFFLLLVLGVTGGLLMFEYVPSVERAYDDIIRIQSAIPFGALLRNLHRWAAELMVLTVFLHLCRVFYTGAYKPPREFNWIVGLIAGFLTLAFSYTGYLLPWDQLAYWGITVGSNIAGYTPLVGDQVRALLLGGPTVGQPALIRFYNLHVFILPFIIVIVLGIHFWRVRKDGGISGPPPGKDKERGSPSAALRTGGGAEEQGERE